MCGRRHQRQAAAHGGCRGSRTAYNTQPHMATAGVAGVITSLQQMRVSGATSGNPVDHAPQYRDVEGRSLEDFMTQQQLNGVIYTPGTTVVGDEDRADDFDKLPSYDDSVAGDRFAERNMPSDNKQSSETTRSLEEPHYTQPTRAAGLPMPAADLTRFQSALNSYKGGACGGRRQAKRAAKDLVREMYEAETARRRAEKERLECGERKQIRRELKPVKQMLKDAVWEARRERTGCC